MLFILSTCFIFYSLTLSCIFLLGQFINSFIYSLFYLLILFTCLFMFILRFNFFVNCLSALGLLNYILYKLSVT